MCYVYKIKTSVKCILKTKKIQHLYNNRVIIYCILVYKLYNIGTTSLRAYIVIFYDVVNYIYLKSLWHISPRVFANRLFYIYYYNVPCLAHSFLTIYVHCYG